MTALIQASGEFSPSTYLIIIIAVVLLGILAVWMWRSSKRKRRGAAVVPSSREAAQSASKESAEADPAPPRRVQYTKGYLARQENGGLVDDSHVTPHDL